MAKQQERGLVLRPNFLLTCSDATLASHELALLAECANIRSELQELFDRWNDTTAQVAVVKWFRRTDRQALKYAIENEESPIEWAQRKIRDGRRTEEELIPLPALEPGAAHLAAALRYQQRNIAEGKCCVCPEPLARTSVRYCEKHLAAARNKSARQRGVKGEPGSRDYMYGEISESTHGRQPGSMASLALGTEKQTRRVLAEMGVPPESAATVKQAVESAILKLLPTSEAVGVKENDLFAMIGTPPSRETARKALMGLLKAGKIGRVGQGVAGDPFLYFKK